MAYIVPVDSGVVRSVCLVLLVVECVLYDCVLCDFIILINELFDVSIQKGYICQME